MCREAIWTLAEWAVAHVEFDYLTYPVDKANIASRKIPESLGGQVFAEKLVTALGGQVLDEVIYKIPYELLVSSQYFGVNDLPGSVCPSTGLADQIFPEDRTAIY